MRKKRNNQSPINNLLVTIGFASLFTIVLVFYLIVGTWIDKMKEDERINFDLILALKIKKDELEVKRENLYVDENILRLAKIYINRYSKQASPKGSIYMGKKN